MSRLEEAENFVEKLEESLTFPRIGVAPGADTPMQVVAARHAIEAAEADGQNLNKLRAKFSDAAKKAYAKYAAEAVDWVQRGLHNDGVHWNGTLIDDAAAAIAEAKRQDVDVTSLETRLEELRYRPRPDA